MELSYPSDAFPGPPTVRMQLPDSWVAHPAASAIIGAVDRDSPEDFASNVVAIVTRILDGLPLEQMVRAMWAETVGRYPNAEQLESRRGTIAGHPSATTVIALRSPDTTVPVAQVQTIVFVPTVDPGQRDLIQLHGTCKLEVLSVYQPVFEAVFASLTVA